MSASLPALPDRIGRYRVLKQLGKGSMGVVYEAVPDGGGEAVAVKVFYPDTQMAPAELQHLKDRFEREGAALSSLHHRNVVQVLEVGAANGREFIVMEKLAGFNLKELFELGTRFTLAESFDIMLQLLAGLAACHRASLVHRDVKPANVVRMPDGTVKLTDFGIARVLTEGTLARAGTVVGTPNYMSPEQIRGEDVDPRSDVFSGGVLLYELLTAKKPFDGPDVTAIMYNVTTIQPPTPRFYNGVLPDELDAIVFGALAKSPHERYSSADEFAQALRDLEQSLHYREGTEAILAALPAAPDPDALVGSPSGGAPSWAPPAALGGTAAGAQTGPRPGGQRSIGGIPVGTANPTTAIAAGMQSGTVYCVDCGAANAESSEFCRQCMRPLLKRGIVTQLAAQQAKAMAATGRTDYLFLTCLSIVMVGVLILILYLFFRGVT